MNIGYRNIIGIIGTAGMIMVSLLSILLIGSLEPPGLIM
jgi:hypothetical protein